ncbi:MAG: VOC family protein [Alphaproteobacteria bacterium]|jgi:hypothetical protein|nr:VOC family protein [Alphaproteobacteria bacterium]
MSGYDLAYLALVVADMQAAEGFFGDALNLKRTDLRIVDRTIPMFGVGKSALALFAPDDPFLDEAAAPGVHHMALVSGDPEAAAHGLPVVDTMEGPGGARQALIDPAATCGVRTRFSEPIEYESGPEGPVERIDHLGIASADNEAAIRVFCDNLGCPLESQQTDLEIRTVVESFTSDKYGVVRHERPEEIVGGLRDAFITIGDCELEFLEDFDPNLKPREIRADQAGNTKGDQSAIARYVERRGPGLHHLGLKTPDINALLPKLADAGYRMIDTVGRPGGRASLIGFVHPSSFGGGLVVHFVEREEV